MADDPGTCKRAGGSGQDGIGLLVAVGSKKGKSKPEGWAKRGSFGMLLKLGIGATETRPLMPSSLGSDLASFLQKQGCQCGRLYLPRVKVGWLAVNFDNDGIIR